MTFSVFGLTAYGYGLCAAMAAALVLIGMALTARGRFPRGTVSVFGVLAVPLGVIGARLMYCLFNLPTFTETYENAWLMLRFFDGGFSMTGLIAGVALAGFLTARSMKVRMGELMDTLCLFAGIALALLRFGEAFTDLGVGKVVEEGFATRTFPWLFQQSRMGVGVEFRMNVWLYEAIAGVLLWAAMLFIYPKLHHRSGDTALFFIAAYGAAQVLLESLRDDGHMLLIFLRVGQIGAAILPVIVCALRCGRAGVKRRVITWVVMALCVGIVVVLEFSLDGRLTIGHQTLARDYGIMAPVCAVFGYMPCSLLFLPDRQKG